jgi:hypothetical protein
MVNPDLATKSLLRVGDGRGFIVAKRGSPWRRYVITAAHCLPIVPDPLGVRVGEEVFENLLGPLGGENTVWAQCLYVDPIADAAVLHYVRGEGPDRSEAYGELVDLLTPLRLGTAAPMETPAFLVALDGRLISCTVRDSVDGQLYIANAIDGIADGMSGTPVIRQDGAVVGIVSRAIEEHDGTTEGTSPHLATTIPGWLLLELGASGLLATARRELLRHRLSRHR